MSNPYDSHTLLMQRQPYTKYERVQKLLNASSSEPTVIFENTEVHEQVFADIIIHNTHSSALVVTLRHIYAVADSPGTLVNQFYSKSVAAGDTIAVTLGKVLKKGDTLIGWAATTDLVTVHVDYSGLV